MPLPFEEEDESTIGRNDENDDFEIDDEDEDEDEDDNKKNKSNTDMKISNSLKKSEKIIEIANKSKNDELEFLDIISDMVLTGYADGHQPENLLMEIKGYKFAQNKV